MLAGLVYLLPQTPLLFSVAERWMHAGLLPLNHDCRSFTTQSCMCCVSLSAIPSGVVSHHQLCLLMWCLFKGHAFWRGASLSATPVGVVSHYSPCLLMWCLTIAHSFWCGASLSAMSAGVLPHYRPCLLVWCLIISHAFYCGVSL